MCFWQYLSQHGVITGEGCFLWSFLSFFLFWTEWRKSEAAKHDQWSSHCARACCTTVVLCQGTKICFGILLWKVSCVRYQHAIIIRPRCVSRTEYTSHLSVVVAIKWCSCGVRQKRGIDAIALAHKASVSCLLQPLRSFSAASILLRTCAVGFPFVLIQVKVKMSFFLQATCSADCQFTEYTLGTTSAIPVVITALHILQYSGYKIVAHCIFKRCWRNILLCRKNETLSHCQTDEEHFLHNFHRIYFEALSLSMVRCFKAVQVWKPGQPGVMHVSSSSLWTPPPRNTSMVTGGGGGGRLLCLRADTVSTAVLQLTGTRQGLSSELVEHLGVGWGGVANPGTLTGQCRDFKDRAHSQQLPRKPESCSRHLPGGFSSFALKFSQYKKSASDCASAPSISIANVSSSNWRGVCSQLMGFACKG